MANIDVNVIDGNNINLVVSPSASSTLVVESGFGAGVAMELYPAPTQVINIDRGVPGNGIASVSVIDIGGSQYLHITFTNGTTSDVGPIATSTYFGVPPIVVTGDEISLSTVPVLLGGTGATTASGARTNLGLGTIATQNASSVAITGGSISGITDLAVADGGTGASTAEGARTNLGLGSAAVLNAGVANGVATLDAGGTVPLSQIPASIQGGVSYQGTWNATTNSPTLTSSVGTKGYYYVVSVAGSTNLNGITNWNIGDWAIFNGTAWEKIDNTDAVTSVNGLTGTVVLTNTDISGFGTMSTQNANSVAITGGTESGVTHSGDIIGNYLDYTPSAAPTYAEGRTWYDSTAKALSYYNDVSGVQVHVGHDLQFKVINNTGSTIPNGSPVYITGTSSGQTYPNVALAKADVAATSSVIGLTDGAIANGAFGYVTSIGNIDNVNTGTFTVGQVLYLSPYSAGQLMNTLPPTGITVQVGVVTFVNSSTGKIYVKQTTPLSVPASIITGAVAIANGGTGQTTRQDAMDALAGSTTSGQYLRGNGTDVVMSAIQVADVPTLNQNTTGTAANVTGTVAIANGGTGQTTADNAFNALAPSQTSNSGKYLTTNGTSTSWASVDALPSQTGNSGKYLTTNGTIASWAVVNAGAALSNDTTTATNLYPIFAASTTGTPTTVYTSDAQYLFKPSTGELSVKAPRASNGIVVNSATISSDYTIATGDNGMSAGPVAVNSGVTVTVSSGSVWTVVERGRT
jgi:hypothetical protein